MIEGAVRWELLSRDMEAAAALLGGAAGEPAAEEAEEAAYLLVAAAALSGSEPLGRVGRALRAALASAEGGEVLPRELAGPLREVATALVAAAGQLARGAGAAALGPLGPLEDRLRAVSAPSAAAQRRAAAAHPTPPPAAAAWSPLGDDRMLDAFVEEAGERLESLGQKLLQLEGQPQNQELIRDVFRDLHTIKGSAAFVGLQAMNQLAHRAEDLVGQLRQGERAVDRAAIDALLGALDGLRAILERAAARAPVDVDLWPYLERLAVPTAAAEAAPPTPPPAVAPPDAGVRSRHTLRVDFDKLDLLLNLVGELVVSKARLHTSLSSLSVLAHDLGARLRRARRGRVRAGGLQPERRPVPLEEIGRLQRLLATTVHELADGGAHLDHVAAALRDQVMKLRMVPVARVFNKHHRTVRELSLALGKQVRLEIEGAETELDKMLVEQLDDPLVHLVRNAIDHGIEEPEQRTAQGKPAEGVLRLCARHRGSQILITVQDDGRGIDHEAVRQNALDHGLLPPDELQGMEPARLLDLLFRPGFSTAPRVSEISGRGVGLDVVQQAVQRLQGSIEVQSTPGQGTVFLLRLPLTLAIIQVLVVQIGGELYTLPLDVVTRAARVPRGEVHRLHDRDVILMADSAGNVGEVPLIDLAAVLGLEAAPRGEALQVVLVEVGGATYGLVCDRQLGKREIVIKSLGELVEEAPCIAGATLIDDRVVLLLDLGQIVQRTDDRRLSAAIGEEPERTPRRTPLPPAEGPADPIVVEEAPRVARILLVEDSALERESLGQLLRQSGYEVVAAGDGRTAFSLSESDATGFDLICTDLTMPDMDGYELTRRLRAQPRHHDVPILMVSARSEPLDRVRGFDAGVDEYLVKPLDPRRLLGAIRRHLRQPRNSRPSTPPGGRS